MAAYTPGPWTIAPCELETSIGQPFCGQFYVVGPHCSDGRFKEADARLISTAPDMIAALRDARDVVGEFAPGHEVLLDKIDAVIAKAVP